MVDGSIILLDPGHVHQLISANNILGWVMFFDGKFIDRNARSALELSLNKIIYLQLIDSELSFFNDLLKLIHLSSKEEKHKLFHLQLLHSLINVCFYKVVNLHTILEQQNDHKYSLRPIEITQNFKNLVKTHFILLKKPSDYASLMNISVSHLNDTIKKLTGFNTTYFIHQEVIGEAQKQLIYSMKNITEIASILGYDDYKYFIRLFTKIIGVSPLKFRKEKHNLRKRNDTKIDLYKLLPYDRII